MVHRTAYMVQESRNVLLQQHALEQMIMLATETKTAVALYSLYEDNTSHGDSF